MNAKTVSNHTQRLTVQIAIGFFLAAAILGALMRLMYLWEIPFLDYRNVMHAHSHTAIMSWGFTILAGAMVLILGPDTGQPRVYSKALIGNMVAGSGIFISFLYQGYGAISIIFCTAHLLVAYYFSWHYLKDIQKLPQTTSIKFAKWAVYWMVISTAGLWAIAPISIMLGKLHPLYFSSIQFFLHLQFNGWFTFGILALLFKQSEDNGHPVYLPKYAFLSLQISVMLTYALSVTWSTPKDFLFYLNSVGVMIQIVAFTLITKGFFKSADLSIIKGNLSGWLLRIGLLSLGLKVMVQGAVSLPFIAMVSYTIKNFVIGFIHLSMLGAFSLSLIGLLLYRGIFPETTMAVTGYRLLVSGFILTEAMLFIQGILLWVEKGFMPYYHAALFGVTLLLPLALIFLFLSFFNGEKYAPNIKSKTLTRV